VATDTLIPLPTDTPSLPPTDTPIPSSTPTLPPLSEEGNPIIWVVPNRTDDPAFLPAIDRVIELMLERTGLALEIVLANSHSEIIEKLCNGDAHIGVLTAFSYIYASEKGCAEVSVVADFWGFLEN
jgi:ABC-type phosphate/phosphonate transport system substrate-binding protein